MKTSSRLSKVLNFFAFNFLFFALYLNFVHNDSNAAPVKHSVQTTTSIKTNVLVEPSGQYVQKANFKKEPSKKSTEEEDNAKALKLYFN